MAAGVRPARHDEQQIGEPVQVDDRLLVHPGAPGERDHGSLSGGQRQRALLARALIRRPRTLLFDEPTSGLDLTAEHALLRLLERLHQEEGLTVVVVTHDLSLAARYATHVAAFHQGSVTAGTRDVVLTDEILRRVYGMGVRIDAAGVSIEGEGGK